MDPRNRRQLAEAIERLVLEPRPGAHGHPARGEHGPGALRQRVDALLDAYLLDSQPIVGTQATIVLADIRGFTALTEAHPPSLIIRLLNRYFTIMSCVVKRHGGVIDKFMGDAVMALFGAPRQRPDDALRALACAVEMQQAMAELNLELEARGEPRLYLGIAVNTGQVMAGSFGSIDHREYTVIGDAVNLVARMEAFSLRGQVLVSEATLDHARDWVRIGARNEVLVKGHARPLVLHELRAVSHPERLVVPRVDLRTSPRIQVDFPVLLRPVTAKRVMDTTLPGRALDLGYNGMLVDLPVQLDPSTELFMTLAASLQAQPIGGLDARVVRSAGRGAHFETSLQFTSLDTPAHAQVKRFVDSVLWGR
jgi:adenylate cyclase